LQLAAIQGHPAVIELLLKEGASLADRDKEGYNALDLAITYNQKYKNQSFYLGLLCFHYYSIIM
jgi:ankyrin repeat protein